MKDSDVIVYNGKRYTRYGKSKYYWHHGEWKKPPVSLHVQVWKDNCGVIPKGHIIHHKDGNPRNNALSNLECITEKEHKAIHYANKEWSDRTRKKLSKAQLNRPLIEYTCKKCGKKFKSRRNYDVFFCSDKCGRQWRLEHNESTKEYEKRCKKCGVLFNTTKWHRKLCYNCYKERSDVARSGII